jgi:hypothetical protein
MSARGRPKRRANAIQNRERDGSVPQRRRLRRNELSNSDESTTAITSNADNGVTERAPARAAASAASATSTDEPRWRDVPENWGIPRLMSELEVLDIFGMSASMGKRQLLIVYNKTMLARQTRISAVSRDIASSPSLRTPPEMTSASTVSNMAAPMSLEGQEMIMNELRDLRRSVSYITADHSRAVTTGVSAPTVGSNPRLIDLVDSASIPTGRAEATAIASVGRINTLNVPRVSMDSLPPVDIVPEQIRKDIHTGKYVNLALLLLPGIDHSMETKIIDTNGEQVIVKASDPRLNKALTYPEFRRAYTKFKNIICDVNAGRRAELDAYGDYIAKLSEDYGSGGFYQYHVGFARKAAQFQIQNDIPVDWALRDTELFFHIFGVPKKTTCKACGMFDHMTPFCPLALKSNFRAEGSSSCPSNQGQSKGSNSKVDKRGRDRVKVGDKEICNNYNDEGCARTSCAMLHVCKECKVDSHSMKQCPSKV